MITLKTPQEIEILNTANRIVHEALHYITHKIRQGITTKELDIDIENFILSKGGKPSFKGYRGFPASSCISINDEIVHGIPSERIIENGDIVSIDIGVEYKGWHGDSAKTIIVGKVSEQVKNIVKHTHQALLLGIEQVKVGNRLSDISLAISSVANKYDYSIVKQLCGHGIGKILHEKPCVFNYVNNNEPNIRIQNGMVLALEPMFILGKSDKVMVMEDRWTVKSNNGSISSHSEFSVAVVNDKPHILGK